MARQVETKHGDVTETQERLLVLRQLIREGNSSTQDELCEALKDKKYDVTQSTVSRDLRRIGAIKTTNAEGEVIYKLPEDHQALPPRVVSHSLDGLLVEIQGNDSMIVLHTTPGSASLVARHLDSLRESFGGPLGILGTIAGDDTIFVVPANTRKIAALMGKIKEEFY